jgi:ribonuclease E
MSKKMLINASHPEENRVAIVVDGLLSELDIELAGQQQTKGNIYKAVVVRVEPGLQAAFVDYGAEKHGFLQTGEIHPDLHPPQKKSSKEYPRINEILHRGQEILVQVVKGERGTKGAALTTFLSLPGRYMVLMPDSNTKGVSRKILDEKERKTLKKTMAQLNLPEEMGYIVRTAGIGKEEAELKRDFDYLVSLYKGILARKEKVKAPAQLYQESDIVIRSIRDYFSTEMDEVLIDDSQVYQKARDFFALVMPDQLHLVKQHREKRPIFSRYQIEEQIDSLSRNQVLLPSGGSIVIDQTEALVAIDVNSGRMAGEKGIEATAARSNIEAAAEIGRQLRLRDLGGLIVIDFIDMRDRKKIREVEQTLKESVQDDKARISLGKISQFGLLELSRQRIRPTLSVGAYLDCPHCHGKGRIKSPDAQAVALLRQLHAAVSKGQIGTIKATIPLDVANYLHNERRQALTDLEKRFDLKIQILASLDAIPEQVELELLKREKVQVEDEDQTPVSHSEALEQALASANAPRGEKTEEIAGPAAEVRQEQATTEIAASDEAEDAAETPSGKRRRRRRRKRRNGSAETLQGESPAENSETEPDLEPVSAQTDPSADSPLEPLATSRDAALSQSAKDDVVVADPNSPASLPAAAEKPKPGRRKPAAKKVAEAVTPATAKTTAPITATQEQIVTQVEPPQTAGTPEPTDALPEKAKRRRRKPAAKKVAEAVTPATTETTPPVTPVPEQVTAEVEPPQTASIIEPADVVPEKAKRRRRKPAAKKVAETEVRADRETAPAVPENPSQTTENRLTSTLEPLVPAGPGSPKRLAEKPKRSPRKPATRKIKELEVTAAASPAEPSAEKPKSRPRKPPAKKAEPVAAVAPPAPASPVTEKPKRRSSKPVTAKSED